MGGQHAGIAERIFGDNPASRALHEPVQGSSVQRTVAPNRHQTVSRRTAKATDEALAWGTAVAAQHKHARRALFARVFCRPLRKTLSVTLDSGLRSPKTEAERRLSAKRGLQFVRAI